MRGYKKDIKRMVKEIKADVLNKEAHEASYTTSDGHYNLFLQDYSVEEPVDFFESTVFDIELNRNCDGQCFANEKDDFDIRVEGQLEDCVKRLLELATETERSIHRKADGRVFQMLDAFSKKPMPYSKGKHNYTRKTLNELEVGSSNEFRPMYGNKNPVCTIVVRLA